MSLPDRLEQVGIVVGCAILLALPTSALLGIFVDAVFLPWQLSLLALLPGIPVGFLAASESRLTYGHVWRFAITNWLVAFVLWGAFDISQDGTELGLALACWGGAFVAGLAVATTDSWLPQLRS
ncbi:hypothetical protein OB905_08265 [Halobacteria archaeon AArc-dxtr1]|nr:hypothetical protein [Halobacteria archaeon AArc-dxtr1]